MTAGLPAGRKLNVDVSRPMGRAKREQGDQRPDRVSCVQVALPGGWLAPWTGSARRAAPLNLAGRFDPQESWAQP